MIFIIILLVPLPIPFDYSLNQRLLTVTGKPPARMNIPSTYEFQLFIDDQKIFERNRISDLNPQWGITLDYVLIPNRTHTFVFKHIVPSIGYSLSEQIIFPSKNICQRKHSIGKYSDLSSR